MHTSSWKPSAETTTFGTHSSTAASHVDDVCRMYCGGSFTATSRFALRGEPPLAAADDAVSEASWRGGEMAGASEPDGVMIGWDASGRGP